MTANREQTDSAPLATDGDTAAIGTAAHGSVQTLEDLPEGRRCPRCQRMQFTTRPNCPRCGVFLPSNTAALKHGGRSRKALEARRAAVLEEWRSRYRDPNGGPLPRELDAALKQLAVAECRVERAVAYSETLSDGHALEQERVSKVIENAQDRIARFLAIVTTMEAPANGGTAAGAPARVVFGGRWRQAGELLPPLKIIVEDHVRGTVTKAEGLPASHVPLVIDRVSTREELQAVLGGVEDQDGCRELPAAIDAEVLTERARESGIVSQWSGASGAVLADGGDVLLLAAVHVEAGAELSIGVRVSFRRAEGRAVDVEMEG